MNFKQLLFILLFSVANAGLEAQVTQVSVGEGYSQQAFFSLSSGEVTIMANNAWDIAFSNEGMQDAGIFINEAAGSGAEGIGLFATDVVEWADVIVDEGQFADSLRLYNAEENWTEGAFNSIKDTSNAFDYGWGSYNPATNAIEGSAIFVLKLRDGSLQKFQATALDLGTYNFRYANLDGSEEVSQSVSKNSESGSKLKLFSLTEGEEVEMPKNYDLIFQRYVTDLDAGDGTTIPYTVTGVLSAPGVEVAEADGVDPETVQESDYADQYEGSLKIIGHDWKSFDFAQGWLIDPDRVYFVKASDGSKHKIVFFDFEGSSTGNITLERTDVISSSLGTSATLVKHISIYPNPFAHHVMVSSESNSEGLLAIYSSSGKLVRELPFAGERSIDLSELVAGSYLFRLTVDEEVVNKIIVKY